MSDEDQYNITSLPNRPDEEYAYTSLLLWQERNGNELTSGKQLNKICIFLMIYVNISRTVF